MMRLESTEEITPYNQELPVSTFTFEHQPSSELLTEKQARNKSTPNFSRSNSLCSNFDTPQSPFFKEALKHSGTVGESRGVVMSKLDLFKCKSEGIECGRDGSKSFNFEGEN